MILYLIRHGNTYCNEKKLYCGKSDISLSESGVNELKKKIESINYPKCKNNYTSGLKRTNETFQLIYPKNEYQVLEGFSEYNFGEFELKSYEELKEDKKYIDWILDETLEVKPPKGESRKEFKDRLSKTLLNLIKITKENNENEALVVCHGGTIASVLESFNDEGLDFYKYQPKCGGGYKLKVNIEGENIKLDILERF